MFLLLMLSQFLLINELQLYVTNQNCYLHGNKFELTWKFLDSNTKVNNGGKECNCSLCAEYSLSGVCFTKSIIYKAFVSANNLLIKSYYELTEGVFKTRWENYKTSFTYVNCKYMTELFHYIWELRDKRDLSHDGISISRGLEQRSSKY